MGPEFLHKCAAGVTCYVVVRPLSTVAALVCSALGAYSTTDFSPSSAYLYIAIANTLAQGWAMYCLILFYQAFKHDMAAVRPLAKATATAPHHPTHPQQMLTIKLVVFFSFWQAVFLAGLERVNVIKQNETWSNYSADAVAEAVQDFAICIEMFLAAIAHHFCQSDPRHTAAFTPGSLFVPRLPPAGD